MSFICICITMNNASREENFVENYTGSILTNKNHSGTLCISKDKTLNLHTSVKVTAIINAAGTCVMGFASHDYKRDYKGSFWKSTCETFC